MRSLILCSLLFSAPSFAQTVDHLFIPSGFDNNDNVEVVVTGKFPNPCFSGNKIEVEVDNDMVFINVIALPKEDKNQCEKLKVPFSERVNIGSLQAGDYKVFVNKGSASELRGDLEVALSTSSSVDDHIYAQVDYVELGFTGGLSGDAMLIGSSVSPCLVLDKVEYISNKSDTYSILPIMKKVSQNCPEKKSRLAIPVKFDPKKLASDKILLFVRSIDGKSAHAFVNKN